jgi:hypothetical protein
MPTHTPLEERGLPAKNDNAVCLHINKREKFDGG